MKTFNTTMGELYDLEQSIIKAGVMNMSFSRKGSFSISRNMKKIANELEEYKAQRGELIKQYSDGSDSIGPDSPHWAEFLTEFQSLSSVATEISRNTVTQEDFPEEITPVTCVLLEFMLEDEKEESKED